MKSKGNVFLAAILGNALEYYDFTVYAVFSAEIGRNFFSSENELVQILSSLAIFAVGFLTRPIGSILFGYIGDNYGRRTALITSVLGMSIPTILISIIPEYSVLGVFSTVLLICMRLMQGLCISGEGTGAAIFILEHYKFHPGFITGIIHSANILGTLLAGLIGILFEQPSIVRILNNNQFTGLGIYPSFEPWRYAFLLGGLIGIIGFFLRLRVTETPEFLKVVADKKIIKSPLIHVINYAPKQLILTFCIGGIASCSIYIIKSYLHLFYCNVMGLTKEESLTYFIYCTTILMFSMPIIGYLADKFGRLKTMFCFTLSLGLSIYYLLLLIGSETLIYKILGLTLLGIMSAGIAVSGYTIAISLFKPEEKFTGFGFSYNLGVTIFGGTVPIISRYLIEVTDNYYALAWYVTALCVSFLIVLFRLRKIVPLR